MNEGNNTNALYRYPKRNFPVRLYPRPILLSSLYQLCTECALTYKDGTRITQGWHYPVNIPTSGYCPDSQYLLISISIYMAKFTGIPPITGTIGPICIYKMYGKYYLRTRSSLTGKRVKKDPAFRKTMEYARLLAKASRIGSAVYAVLPADQKQHSLYRKLTGEAMYWLKHEWSTEDVLAFLLKLYSGQEVQQEPEVTEAKESLRRKTQRLKGSSRRSHTQQLQHKEAPAKKISPLLYAYLYSGSSFRRRCNKDLTVD